MTNIEILVSSGRFKKVEDILLNYDLVVDVLKEDVIKMLAKAGITATSIDDYFAAAAKKIKKNIENKQHLKGIQKLLTCKNIEMGFKIFLSKLRGYTHNNMLQSRKNSVAFYQKRYKNEIETMDVISDPLELLLQEELERAKQAKEKEIEKFKEMVQNGEIKMRKTKAGHCQLCLSFDEAA